MFDGNGIREEEVGNDFVTILQVRYKKVMPETSHNLYFRNFAWVQSET